MIWVFVVGFDVLPPAWGEPEKPHVPDIPAWPLTVTS